MASEQEIVTHAARLVGMGRNVECSLSVRKDPGGTGHISPMICDEPANLPDGIYVMAFGEHTFEVQKLGAWTIPNPA